MTTPKPRPCPNPECGGAEVHRLYRNTVGKKTRVECGCGTSGPWGRNEADADRLWDLMPRWEWRPASDVPEGAGAILVCLEWHEVQEGYFDSTDHPLGSNVTHWMPLPPGPSEGQP